MRPKGPRAVEIDPATRAARDRESEAIGDMLAARNRLSPEQLREAFGLARAWDTGLVQVLMARRWIAPSDLFRDIARHYRLPLADLENLEPDLELLSHFDSLALSDLQTIPLFRQGNKITVATGRVGPDMFLKITEIFGPDTEITIAPPHQITWALQRAFREKHSHRAVYALAELDPEMSAQRVFTPPQVILIYLMASGLFLGLALAPIATLVGINLVLTLLYMGNFLFKALLVWVGGGDLRRSSSLLIFGCFNEGCW